MVSTRPLLTWETTREEEEEVPPAAPPSGRTSQRGSRTPTQSSVRLLRTQTRPGLELSRVEGKTGAETSRTVKIDKMTLKLDRVKDSSLSCSEASWELWTVGVVVMHHGNYSVTVILFM